MTAQLCPLCKFPIRSAGQIVQAVDDAKHEFVFALCVACRLRLDRLPEKLRQRQHRIAIARLCTDQDKYPIRMFPGEIEARLFTALLAEQNPADALQALAD